MTTTELDDVVDDADGQPVADEPDAGGAPGEGGAGAAAATATSTWRDPSVGRWTLFAGIAIAVVVVDQLAKAWIVANLDVGESIEVIGDWLRIVHVRELGDPVRDAAAVGGASRSCR